MTELDRGKTVELIRRMANAGIGHRRRWNSIIRKIESGDELPAGDMEYFATLARIYKSGSKTTRSRMYHVRLSESDAHPPCGSCGADSEFYCSMNDAYYCTGHVVGHDENES